MQHKWTFCGDLVILSSNVGARWLFETIRQMCQESLSQTYAQTCGLCADVGFNASVTIEELGSPDKIIQGFAPELYGSPLSVSILFMQLCPVDGPVRSMKCEAKAGTISDRRCRTAMCWTHRRSAKARSPTTSGESQFRFFWAVLLLCVCSQPLMRVHSRTSHGTRQHVTIV